MTGVSPRNFRRLLLLVFAAAGFCLIFYASNGTGFHVEPDVSHPIVISPTVPPKATGIADTSAPLEQDEQQSKLTSSTKKPKLSKPVRSDTSSSLRGGDDDAVEWLKDLLEFAHNFSTTQGETSDEEFCEELANHMWESELPEMEQKYPLFVKALRKQRERHLAVAAGKPLPGQKYLVWSLSGGMGNRFQSLASTFVAAMVSERVFLMKDWFTPLPKNSKRNVPVIYPSKRTTEYVLEPLDKLFDSPDLKSGKRAKNIELLCPLLPMMSLRQFEKMYPHEFVSATNKSEGQHGPLEDHVKVDISAKHDRTMARWHRFFCSNLSQPPDTFKPSYVDENVMPRGQEGGSTFFFNEKFVYVWTNQYYLPVLYANPFHGKQLRDMFPPSRIYSVLLRVLALPSKKVLLRLGKVLKQKNMPPRGYHAMQIRPFSDKTMHTLTTSFDKCFSTTMKDNKDPFFLATIWPSIYTYFKKKYSSRVITQLEESSINADQNTSDAKSDQEAFTDMLLLSMAKELFVSPGSTFGIFAMAFGEIDVTRVNFLANKCERVTSHQTCFGSWFSRDALAHRLGKLSCKTLPLPSDLMNCK